MTKRKNGFTLAEVLITLAVIGIVAVLTIPDLVKKHNEQSWVTASTVFEKRLDVALRAMITQNEMWGYSSTKDFVNKGLAKHLKIVKTCDVGELESCFPSEFVYGTETLNVKDIKTAGNFDQDEWKTTPYGVMFANGTSALILYNDECGYIDQYSNTINPAQCVAVAYDTNAYKLPNEFNKDLRTINASLSKYTCIAPGLKKETGICVTKKISLGYNSIVYHPTKAYITYDECLTQKSKYGLNYCYNYSNSGYDFYAVKVAECGHISKVASEDQLHEIGNYLYGKKLATTGYQGVTPISDRFIEIFGSVPQAGAFYVATNSEQATRETSVAFGSSQYQPKNSDTRGYYSTMLCVK